MTNPHTQPAPITWTLSDRLEDAWGNWWGETPDGAWWEIMEDADGWTLRGRWVSDGYEGPYATAEEAKTVAAGRYAAWLVERMDEDDVGCS